MYGNRDGKAGLAGTYEARGFVPATETIGSYEEKDAGGAWLMVVILAIIIAVAIINYYPPILGYVRMLAYRMGLAF